MSDKQGRKGSIDQVQISKLLAATAQVTGEVASEKSLKIALLGTKIIEEATKEGLDGTDLLEVLVDLTSFFIFTFTEDDSRAQIVAALLALKLTTQAQNMTKKKFNDFSDQVEKAMGEKL